MQKTCFIDIMPVPYLDKLSKETGKSIAELEKLWGKAKKIASEHFNKPESEFGDKEFAYVVGIVKNMVGKEEHIIFESAKYLVDGKTIQTAKNNFFICRYDDNEYEDILEEISKKTNKSKVAIEKLFNKLDMFTINRVWDKHLSEYVDEKWLVFPKGSKIIISPCENEFGKQSIAMVDFPELIVDGFNIFGENYKNNEEIVNKKEDFNIGDAFLSQRFHRYYKILDIKGDMIEYIDKHVTHTDDVVHNTVPKDQFDRMLKTNFAKKFESNKNNSKKAQESSKPKTISKKWLDEFSDYIKSVLDKKRSAYGHLFMYTYMINNIIPEIMKHSVSGGRFVIDDYQFKEIDKLLDSSRDRGHDEADYELADKLAIDLAKDIKLMPESTVKESLDWSQAERNLMRKGLEFSKYGLYLNGKSLEPIDIWMSNDFTVINFYNEKGFQGPFDGNWYPLAVVVEYNENVDDLTSNMLKRPSDLKMFEDLSLAWKYMNSKYTRDFYKTSRHNNKDDYWTVEKQLFESEEKSERLTVTEDVKIPGANIMIKKGQSFELSKKHEYSSFMVNRSLIKKFADGVDWIFDHYCRSYGIGIDHRFFRALGGNNEYIIECTSTTEEHFTEFEKKHLNPFCQGFEDVTYTTQIRLLKGIFHKVYSFVEGKWNESIESENTIVIKEECVIPGTDIVLEAGDKITIISQMNETNINSKNFSYLDLNLSKVVKHDEWGEAEIIPNKSELNKLTKYLDSLGFKELKGFYGGFDDIADDCDGKPVYNVWIIDHDEIEDYPDGYASVLIYHPNWGFKEITKRIDLRKKKTLLKKEDSLETTILKIYNDLQKYNGSVYDIMSVLVDEYPEYQQYRGKRTELDILKNDINKILKKNHLPTVWSGSNK